MGNPGTAPRRREPPVDLQREQNMRGQKDSLRSARGCRGCAAALRASRAVVRKGNSERRRLQAEERAGLFGKAERSPGSKKFDPRNTFTEGFATGYAFFPSDSSPSKNFRASFLSLKKPYKARGPPFHGLPSVAPGGRIFKISSVSTPKYSENRST